jgi:outer membrane lipoprotein SlyB
VEYGKVTAISPVVIEGTQSGVGQLPGAIVGGIAGSTMGEGKGQQIFTVLGALGGAVLGSTIEENATRSQGLELTLAMDSGKTLSIVQEVERVDAFQVGQRVRVLTQGRLARVSPE